ncbi:VOC family protein [Staphylococcus auricularis]|uniref:VOC family protein n=1 Tax=Staphylococcus auricularis TaxID=29379 RepID=UPI003EB8802B
MSHIIGHHHISMYTKDAKANKDFYTNVLGLRLVEKSVNQDDPSMYHLFFGDEIGTPGTLLSFFELPNIGRNHPGTNSIYRLSLLVPSEEALTFFEQRLQDAEVKTERMRYLGQAALLFKDIDDLEIVLVVNGDHTLPTAWRHNRYTDIPELYQILGLGPVELRVRDKEATVSFLRDVLEYHQRDFDEVTVYTLDDDGLYTDFVVVEQQGEHVRPGRGYVHHIAVNTPSDDDLNTIYKRIQNEPRKNSGIIDRFFFKSLYYRQNKIMFEFATAEPGFTVDTPIEDLGKTLNLPDFMQDRREEIEQNLHEL